MKTLITGGVRSGKSFQAEAMMLSEPAVTYVAPGPKADADLDPEWAARVRDHQRRRPVHWRTVETRDLPAALGQATGAVLVDCLGTWLTALVDELDGRQRTHEEVRAALDSCNQAARVALGACRQHVVLVTNEVGMGVVLDYFFGPMVCEFWGFVSRRIAAHCDDVLLFVPRRTLSLQPPSATHSRRSAT